MHSVRSIKNRERKAEYSDAALLLAMENARDSRRHRESKDRRRMEATR